MLSIQEMIEKTEQQRKEIKRALGSGVFHPESGSIFTDQKPSVVHELQESLRNIPLSEFLAKSGTAGLAGAAYLVPDKLHDMLIFYSKETDKVPIISAQVASQWAGGDLLVAIVNDETYKPHIFIGGGQIPQETMETMKATVSPISFGIPIVMGTDLIEDASFDMIEFHTRQAAKAMGEKATSLAIEVLGTATDGWGTVNSGSTGDGGITKWTGGTTMDILDAIDENLTDGWISNTVITSSAPWQDQISRTLPTGSTWMPVKEGFTHCINNIDVLLHTNATDLTNGSSKLETIVFDRNNALLTGRKRWMEIREYSNPVSDLAGAVVTCRQDSVTLYDDAVCVIAET